MMENVQISEVNFSESSGVESLANMVKAIKG